MIRKQIIATSGLNLQNQQFSVEALAETAKAFSADTAVTRMSINHDSTLPPIGKILSGSLKQLANGDIALEVLIDDFVDSFVPCEGPNGESLYFAESSCDTRPFLDLQPETTSELTIMINPLNFTQNDYNDVVDYLRECCDAQVETKIAKSLLPTPEIIFSFVTGYLLSTLCKQTLSKTSDKLSDAISDDLAKCYTGIKNAIKKIMQKIISRGLIVYIFTEPNQPVELAIKANKVDTVLKALEALKTYDIAQKVQQFNDYTNGNLKKIQFIYDENEAKWEMGYLTTKSGQVIGTEANYKRVVQLYRSTLKSPTAGFSVGGTATITSQEEKTFEGRS